MIYALFPIDSCPFEPNLDFEPNRPKCGSGKFAIFAQNRTWVEKNMKNREKSAESSELIFRFLRLHFGVEITIWKLKNSL